MAERYGKYECICTGDECVINCQICKDIQPFCAQYSDTILMIDEEDDNEGYEY